MSEFRRHLMELGAGLISLDDEQVGLLEAHYEKLRVWMKKMNLTTITVPREMVLRHYVESIWFASRLPDWVLSLLDAGSGAGFPGVPAAVLRRECLVTLVEADRRKAVFLEESTLSISNVSVAVGRLEQLVVSVDCVITRAVDVGAVREYAEKHAKWFGVLTSEEIAGKFKWDSVENLPWDPNHVAAFLKVPRETF